VYAALPLQRLIALLVWPFGVLFVAMLIFNGIPQAPAAWLRLIGTTVGIFTIALTLIGGSSATWAPWRIIWALFPALNDKLFPDLNGVWQGTTQSNWPIIAAQAGLVEKPNVSATSESALRLQENKITLTITASFFTFRIRARLHGTSAQSLSLTESITLDRHGRYELAYIYRQATPIPEATDESSHDGAAVLHADMDKLELNGVYWTRRRWQEGLNTAGLLNVKRESPDPKAN
jgi:hypothetical protein